VVVNNASTWPSGPNYICENVVGATWIGGSSPVPTCNNSAVSEAPQQKMQPLPLPLQHVGGVRRAVGVSDD